MNIFRFPLIINTLPVTLTNGTVADATQVMTDLNWIVNQVNANAAPLANTALINANNNFTVVQSGVAATSGANFPIASQVQNNVFNTLTSTLGTNSITGRIAALTLGAYTSGQIFTFIPSATNTGPANLAIDGLGSGIIFSGGQPTVGGEMQAGVPQLVESDGAKFNLLTTSASPIFFMPFITSSGGGSPGGYNTQAGEGERIGNRFIGNFNIIFNALGSIAPGNISISGFPPGVVAVTGTGTINVPMSINNMGSTVNSLSGSLALTTGVMSLTKQNGGVSPSLLASDLTAATIIRGSFNYRVN